MRAAKLFRVIWRVNAVVIFLAGALTLVGLSWVSIDSAFRSSNRADEPPPVVVAAERKEHLTLQPMEAVEGTTVLRGDLAVVEHSKVEYSSDGTFAGTRNVLTIDLLSGKATWLFPTHAQLVVNFRELPDEKKPVVDVRLVKALRDGKPVTEGNVVISDPAGRQSVVVAEHVVRIEGASLTGGNVAIVCQRGEHYVLVTADAHTLAKLSEREIAIPIAR